MYTALYAGLLTVNDHKDTEHGPLKWMDENNVPSICNHPSNLYIVQKFGSRGA